MSSNLDGGLLYSLAISLPGLISVVIHTTVVCMCDVETQIMLTFELVHKQNQEYKILLLVKLRLHRYQGAWHTAYRAE